MVRLVWLLGLGLAVIGLAGSAFAESGRTTWTTYLYQGPGTRYQVVDELQQLTPIDVLSCNEGWCQVRVGDRFGYLQSDIVSRGDPASPQKGVLAQPAAALTADPGSACFEALQTGGNGGRKPTVFCRKN